MAHEPASSDASAHRREGQVNHYDDDAAVEPVDLIAAACARPSTPCTAADRPDPHRQPALLALSRSRRAGGAAHRRRGAATFYSGGRGNTPQSLVNQACLDIQSGKAQIVLIAGGETWRTRMRLRSKGIRPDWTKQSDSVPAPGGDDVPMSGPTEEHVGLDRPSFVYPIFEQAIRIADGESAARTCAESVNVVPVQRCRTR